jgi:tetratricopeptide (TPR) repeat protein
MDTETLALFLHSCDTLRDSPLETRDALIQVVAREPHFPFARARLALSAVIASSDAPAPMRQSLRASARAEAQRALRDDRSVGESYIALEQLETPTNWAGRENLLREALDRDELNATVNNFYARLLSDVGRVYEALAFAQRGVTLDPLSPSKRRNLAYMRLMNGQYDEARDIVESMAAAWPEDPALWRARMRAALWARRYDDALALLDAPASSVRSGEARACWRQAVQYLREPTRAPQSAQRLIDCQRADRLPGDVTVTLLIILGDLDDAFALLRAGDVGNDVLFAPESAALRADPRFMPLMRDMGLLRYWRLSAHWPDFCREPGLPYRCQAEAERLI